jgi:hypothetical protein
MWKHATLFLLGALMAPIARGQSTDVLLTMPITIDGSLKNLQLMRGESFEDAATSFARVNGLMNLNDDTKVRAVIDQLSTLLKDKMEEIQATTPAPVVQFALPLNIDGYTIELKKYEGESAESAVERYLNESPFTLDVKRQLVGQLLELVNQKIMELQPPAKELFSFTITIDGVDAVVRHFENGNAVDEAKEALRGLQFKDAALYEQVVGQIANEIIGRVNAQKAPVQEPVQQQLPKQLFSIALTLNNQNIELVHYEGFTAAESVIKFLNDHGITEPDTINSYGPQLVQLVENKIAENAQQQEAATTAAAAAPTTRTPLFTVPVTLGQNQVTLEYYEGDNIERTAEVFLQYYGLDKQASFPQLVGQLSTLIRQRLEELNAQTQQQSRPEPLFTIPVTLGGVAYNLEYFEGQEPNYVANTFCVEKHEILREQLGLEYDGNQLQECKNVLVGTINNILNNQQQTAEQPQQQTAEQHQTQPTEQQQTQPTETQKPTLLFTMDIEIGEDLTASLPFYRGEDPVAVATAFCEKHNVDKSNVKALVDAIQAQLAGN